MQRQTPPTRRPDLRRLQSSRRPASSQDERRPDTSLAMNHLARHFALRRTSTPITRIMLPLELT